MVREDGVAQRRCDGSRRWNDARLGWLEKDRMAQRKIEHREDGRLETIAKDGTA